MSSCLRALRKGDARFPRATSPLLFRERVRIVARDEQKSIFRSAKSLHRSRNFDMQGCRSQWIAHSRVEVDAQHRTSQIQFTLHLGHALHALMLLLPQTRVRLSLLHHILLISSTTINLATFFPINALVSIVLMKLSMPPVYQIPSFSFALSNVILGYS